MSGENLSHCDVGNASQPEASSNYAEIFGGGLILGDLVNYEAPIERARGQVVGEVIGHATVIGLGVAGTVFIHSDARPLVATFALLGVAKALQRVNESSSTPQELITSS